MQIICCASGRPHSSLSGSSCFSGASGIAPAGLVLIVVGGWLLLNTLGLVSLDLWEFFVPLLLVFLGARIMMHNRGPRSALRRHPPARSGRPEQFRFRLGRRPSEPVHASLFSLMSSSKRRWGKSVFRGAEATAVMGGCELDLRDALMGPGELAVIEVFVIMGGVIIFVPPHWTVSQEVVPLMGGVEDKTHSVPSNPAQHLLVRGTVVMGGVEISN